MIRDRKYWIDEIQKYFDLKFSDAVEVWGIVSGYLINTRANSRLALRVVLNGDCPGLSMSDKECLNLFLRKKIL